MNERAPLGVTRTPKPGTSESQRKVDGAAPSIARFVSRIDMRFGTRNSFLELRYRAGFVEARWKQEGPK